MPSRIAEYVSQHKNELKGAKGDTGEQGDRGVQGSIGTPGTNGASGSTSFDCTTYGINNQYTTCN